ncbi:MAG: (deoxy)nucleoside triphosphate pyrophosphohydrolase [Lachnospiraceae bacterium]|nr:(deoxy)nucleoside triphosphate pyrophosphohydrolase [Lachnospiraceae bacterium]
MKKFNTTGTCVPNRHYMVDTSEKLDRITRLIENEDYFTINRSRQYGKTTTMVLLKNRLKDKYEVINISFEGIGDEPFSSNVIFTKTFVEQVFEKMEYTKIDEEDKIKWNNLSDFNEERPIKWLSKKITDLCRNYPVILMVDEMDKCSDNQVFLNFLGMLRDKYLARNIGEDYTFKSVILAGVYDVKNLKLKLRPDEERKYNSPWNIAVDINVDMSFHPEEIATMLSAYEEDAHTGMDIKTISEELYHYTHGYPYLVSWLCKWMDEEGNRNWSEDGIQKAQKAFLKLHCMIIFHLLLRKAGGMEAKKANHKWNRFLLRGAGDKIFATQRGYGEFKGGWEFPGGKIEEGETPEQALKREIEEELDTKIEVYDLIDTIEYDYPNFHLSMDCFWCETITGKLVLKEAAKWLSKDELESVQWLPADLTLVKKIRNEMEGA